MNQVYQSIGISKQAIHQYSKRQRIFDEKISQLLVEVDELRKEHPGCGVEKMYLSLMPDFIGRDRFIEVFMALGYRIVRKKNYRKTTIASKLYYPNLIKGIKVNGPSIIWQSDITYIDIGGSFCYAVFIIDVYTKKIVGYSVANHMRAKANVRALKMALKHNTSPVYHHSDRGSQYTYKVYINLLIEYKCKISMALSAQDNAYAERINRTIKEEYIRYHKPDTLEKLRKNIKNAVHHYNEKRPHKNLANKTPLQFEKEWKMLDQNYKPILTIFDNEKN